MADVLVTGIKIGDMPLKGTVSGDEKLPTGDVGDLAVTPNQIKDFTIQEGNLVNQEQLDDAIESVEQTASGLAGRVQTLENRTSNVDNTADLDKPISNATQAALDLKANKADVYDKTQTYSKSEVYNRSEITTLLSDKADLNSVYTKTETYSKTETDAKFSNINHNSLLNRNQANQHSASAIQDQSGRSLQDKNNDYIVLKDYQNLKVGNDWSDAIIKALADGKAASKALYIPSGVYDYSKSFTIEVPVYGSGREVTRLRKTAPAEITILKGCLNNITVSADALISGDTTRGVILDGLDRKDIYDLWVERHGGHGIDFRRGNLSRFVVHSRSNAGRGVSMSADTLSGDNKALDIFVEANANGLSGFYIEQNANQVYVGSSHYGAIRSQNNGTLDVTDDNYDVVLTGRGHDLNIYCEYGKKSVWLRSGLQSSRIWFSNMSHVTMVDEANDTNIISYIPSALGTRVTKNEKFEKITIQKENSSLSGQLTLSQVANNTYLFSAALSGAQQYIEYASNITVRGENNSYQFAKVLTGGATLNFGSVAAQSSVERTITITGSSGSLQTAVISNPAGNVGNNLVWSSFVSAFDASANTTTVTIRVTNPTGAAITSTQLAWRVQVLL